MGYGPGQPRRSRLHRAAKGVVEMSRSMRRLLRAGPALAVSLIVTVALALPAAGRPSSSRTSPPPAPTPRFEMGMAYDAASGQVVLFGGGGHAWLGDTWTWDGTDWTQRTPRTRRRRG